MKTGNIYRLIHIWHFDSGCHKSAKFGQWAPEIEQKNYSIAVGSSATLNIE